MSKFITYSCDHPQCTSQTTSLKDWFSVANLLPLSGVSILRLKESDTDDNHNTYCGLEHAMKAASALLTK